MRNEDLDQALDILEQVDDGGEDLGLDVFSEGEANKVGEQYEQADNELSNQLDLFGGIGGSAETVEHHSPQDMSVPDRPTAQRRLTPRQQSALDTKNRIREESAGGRREKPVEPVASVENTREQNIYEMAESINTAVAEQAEQSKQNIDEYAKKLRAESEARFSRSSEGTADYEEAVAKAKAEREHKERLKRIAKRKQEIVSKANSTSVSALQALSDITNVFGGMWASHKVRKLSRDARRFGREIECGDYSFAPYGRGYVCTGCPKGRVVEIPAYVNNKPVLAVSPSCWMHSSKESKLLSSTVTGQLGFNIQAVILPDTLQVLFSENFAGLVGVKAIAVPESVKDCPPSAFLLSGIKEVWYNGSIDTAISLFRSSGVRLMIRLDER